MRVRALLWGWGFGVVSAGGCFDDPPALDMDTGSTTSVTTATSGSASMSSTGVDGGSSSSSTSPSMSVGEVDATSSDDITSAGSTDESSTGADPQAWFDEFDRVDAEALGNGWIEATPLATSLLDQRVVGTSGLDGGTGFTWPRHIWYRPAEEHVLDIEVSVDFLLNAEDPANHPQVFARMQPDALGRGAFLGYELWLRLDDDAGPLLRLDRFDGSAGETPYPITEPLSMAPLTIGEWHRLRLRITGSDPVMLYGAIEVDVDGTWEVHTEVSGSDATANRITVPGSWGAGHGFAPQLQNLEYDDYRAEFL